MLDRNPAKVCSPAEFAVERSTNLGDLQPFEVRLRGDNEVRQANGYQIVDLPGPCIIRASPASSSGFDLLSNSNFNMQYLGFLYAPGPLAPLNNDLAIHSRGNGEGYCWHGGRWWFRPVRSDLEVRLTFFPMVCPEASTWILPGNGCANFHSHYGVKLLAMANDGVDPTLPATTTYQFLYSYNIRQNLTIRVPQLVYVNNGGANWTQAGDSVVDQTGAIVAYSQYLIGTNLTRYNQWDGAPATNLGRGLNTIGAGCSIDFSGDHRFPGPMLILNMNRNAPVYVTIEETT
jgi:hypothetical protein